MKSIWTIPTLELTRRAPLWVWLGVSSAWLALFVVYATAVVGLRPWSAPIRMTWGLASLQNALLIGYFPAALVWVQRRVAGVLRALRPALRCEEGEFEAVLRDVRSYRPLEICIAVAVGGTGGLLVAGSRVAWLLSADTGVSLGKLGITREIAARVVPWEALGYLLMGGLLALFFYVGGSLAKRVSDLGADRARIDLVDLYPLRPFVEFGLGSVLAIMVLSLLVGFAVLVFPSPDRVFGVAGPDVPILIAAAVLLPMAAVAALLSPLRGVHRKIEEAKRGELERIRADIKQVRRTGASEGRLADLIAYEGRIEAINAWLFDRSTLVRFGLILGAGMSMVLGALVERAVDAALE